MSQARKILIVEDDEDLRVLLFEQFALHDEFLPTQAGTAAMALRLIEQDAPDVVLMDVGLPDMDGREAVRLMRKRGLKSPIILITGFATDDDAVLGLDSGANDYVNKPFRFAVLLARIRAHLRQHDGSLDALFQIGAYTFSPGAKNLVNDSGDRMRLTEKEVAILRFLYRAGPQVVDRDTLLREVWGYNAAVTTHTLETHIYRLRQKIEPDPGHAQLLVTEGGGLPPHPVTLEQDIRRLAAIPLLASFGTEALRLIAFSAETRMFRAGEILFRRGEPADGGFVLLVGAIELEGATETDTRLVRPGALIGERALVADLARPSTATAREPSTVLKITRRLFYRVMSEFPGSAERIRATMADDLAHRLRGG